MQGNKEHDPIIGERTGTLTSADRIYPIDDWVGLVGIYKSTTQSSIALAYSKLQETQMFKRVPRLCPVLEINLGPPYGRKQTSKKPRN